MITPDIKVNNTPRTVLVTGAGKGIGLAIARHFLEAGDNVWIVNRDGRSIKKAHSQLIEFGDSVQFVTIDLRDPLAVLDLDKAIGDRPLHVLVNNVGNFHWGSLMEMTYPQMRDILDSNVLSSLLVTQALLSNLETSGQGRVVNIGASYVSQIKAFPQFALFAAAKTALLSMTKSMAVELAPKAITVNCVSPGMIDTGSYPQEVIERYAGVIPQGRFGTPEEVVRTVSFLASPDSSYITGSEIIVGGGWEGEVPQE